MKIVQGSRLRFTQAKSDKVYEVDLCDVSSQDTVDQFVVNIRYGRFGTALKEGSKTTLPVAYSEAKQIFDSTVVSRLNQGYHETHRIDAESGQTAQPSQPLAAEGSQTQVAGGRFDAACRRVLTGLADIANDQLEVKKAARMVWRAGELAQPEFAAPLLRLLQRNPEMLEYCLIWAIGRCGDASLVEQISPRMQSAGSPKNRRVALWAVLKLAHAKEAAALLDSIAQQLPESLQAVVGASDQQAIRDVVDGYLARDQPECNEILHQLYLLSLRNCGLRAVLLKSLAVLTPKPNLFRGMRHIYKAAEFFQDADAYGVINLRFDMQRQYYSVPSYGDHVMVMGPRSDWVNVKQELVKSDSRLAYSDKTRHYLRNRSLRHLRRLGELALDAYIEMAMGVLLAHRPEHKLPASQAVVSRWDSINSTLVERSIVYDEYAHLLCLVFITCGGGGRYLRGSRRAWQSNPDFIATDAREEMFPSLWDRHPQALLRLLLQSDFDLVHDFAAKAMAAQTHFFKDITMQQLYTLLAKRFKATSELALAIARQRYTPQQPDFALVFALLDSGYENAVTQGKLWVQEQLLVFAAEADFLLLVVTAKAQDVRVWARMLVDVSSDRHRAQLVSGVFQWLHNQQPAVTDAAQMQDIEWLLLNPLKPQTGSVPFDELLKLLVHPAQAVQVIAGRLILHHQTPVEEIPAAVFTHLLESPSAEVRGVGVALFAKLSHRDIARQPELVESFCVAPEEQARQAIKPAIVELARHNGDFCKTLTRKLIDYLFRRESAPGIHVSLLDLLTQELTDYTRQIDQAINWRLLQAQSAAAQSLGVWLLGSRRATDFSVKQWARLGHHATLACRQWVWQCYGDHPLLVAKAAVEGISILDGPWEDSRQFAFGYFRDQFAPQAWRPELLIAICDSVRPDVQSYGRDLLNQFFDQQHGEEYLLKLSQHPSNNVQLFASNYLQRFASDNIEILTTLEPYFISVLSAVNKNRVSKDRILAFLLAEAERCEPAARLAMRVFSRQSVTMAIADHAVLLLAMRDLKHQYPGLDTPLAIVAPRRHQGEANV